MRKLARILIVAAAAVVGMAGNGWAADKIVMITHGLANDAFWNVVKNGATEAAKETGVDFQYQSPETFDMVAMGQLIDAAVNQRPAGIVVTIPDADALGPSIQRATAAGIPVISINSGSDVSKKFGALLHVGQDEYTAGKVAGAKLKDMGGKKAICINHEVGNVSLDQRCKGFADGFGGPVTVLPTTNDFTEVKSKVRAALDSDPAIDTVLALSAGQSGEPAVAAVEEAQKADKVKVASFDLSANFLKLVSEGKAVFAVDQQQYLQGYLSVIFLATYAKYGMIPGGDVSSGPNLVTKDKAAQVIDLSAKGLR